MVEIRLTNSKTRKKEVFTPIDPENVRMYVCGPTVYDRAHLGNARPVVVFDVLNRLLRHVYGADHVTYVRNFTDVDDKINATALQRKEAGAAGTLEELIAERTEETIGWYHADMDALGTLRPDHEPRATRYIPQMVTMIEGLIASGNAYEAEGHVLFAVDSYAEYGALSGRSVEDMIAGARVEVAPYKKNPMDFVLWKPSSDDLPGWDSPWGRGRPGWHIECSAMADELLGAEFDIHGGGIDLQFPHHENEIAQSCCAHPEGGFANIWLHNEMLQVEGKKMSKSLGNFFTVRDLIEKFDREFAIPNIGPAIRLRFLETHYRSPVEAGQTYIEAAATKLGQWWFWANEHLDLAEVSKMAEAEYRKILDKTGIVPLIADDLYTSKAVTVIDRLVKQLRGLPENDTYIDDWSDRQEELAKQVYVAVTFLGFKFEELADFDHSSWQQRLQSRTTASETIEKLIAVRRQARNEKDFAKADAIRDAFQKAKVSLKDTPEGTQWSLEPGFDLSYLEELL